VFVRNAAAYPTFINQSTLHRFCRFGIPSSQIVRAIENIIYGDSRHLRSMDEDW
jgi:hypothetical protein